MDEWFQEVDAKTVILMLVVKELARMVKQGSAEA
jgi:hypothetical protein